MSSLSPLFPSLSKGRVRVRFRARQKANRKNQFVSAAVLFLTAAALAACGPGATKSPASAGESRIREINAVGLLDGDAYRDRAYVLREIGKIPVADVPSLTVAPFLPFLSFSEATAAADLRDFRDAARARRTHLVFGLVERAADGRTFHTAVVIGPDGEIAGRYRKTHRVAQDAEFALGDDLPVFRTAFGTLGVTLTSDFYFPEAYEVLRLKGAEVLVWCNAPERFREHAQWPPLLFARALDSHAFLAAADYADPRTYITNNYESGMRGAAYGRSLVLDRSGTVRADTGHRDGIARLRFDLDERKADVYPSTPNFENVFYVPNNGGRGAFAPIADPALKPDPLPAFKKRTARIAIGFTAGSEAWTDGTEPAAILRMLKQAEALRPDLVLFSEQSVKDDRTPEVKRGLEAIARWARQNSAYVAVGGVGDEKTPRSACRVWDRTGRLVHVQPIYWMAGLPELRVFDTDFARVGSHTCGDLFTFPIDRVLALRGAELILDPSQMWGPDGLRNEMLLKARAIDNGVHMAVAHWNTSDPGLRSMIVDPYGAVRAGSPFEREGVIAADIDFSDAKVYYAGLRADQPEPGPDNISNYYAKDMPERRAGWREMIFSARRPELYGVIPTENEVTRKYVGKELQGKSPSK